MKRSHRRWRRKRHQQISRSRTCALCVCRSGLGIGWSAPRPLVSPPKPLASPFYPQNAGRPSMPVPQAGIAGVGGFAVSGGGVPPRYVRGIDNNTAADPALLQPQRMATKGAPSWHYPPPGRPDSLLRLILERLVCAGRRHHVHVRAERSAASPSPRAARRDTGGLVRDAGRAKRLSGA